MFPILNAPLVVQTEIVTLMDAPDLISLSLCSEAAYSFVKTHSLRKSTTMELHMIGGEMARAIIIYTNQLNSGAIVLEAKFMSELDSEDVETVKFGSERVPITRHPECLHTYWEDRVHGLKTVIDYTSNVFGLPVARLGSIRFQKDSYWMIDWINERQTTPLRTADLYNKQMFHDEELAYILRNCHPSEYLTIQATVPPNFKFTSPFPNTNAIFIVEGEWITIDNLLTIDSTEFHIYRNSKLSSRDMNAFLKHWQAGGFPRLEYFRVGMASGIDFGQILGDGLEEHVEESTETRSYQGRFFDKTFFGGHSIQNVNGHKATINCEANAMCMAVWKS